MSDAIIREATAEDADAIAEIYNESILAGGATMDDEQKDTVYFKKTLAEFNERETILILRFLVYLEHTCSHCLNRPGM